MIHRGSVAICFSLAFTGCAVSASLGEVDTLDVVVSSDVLPEQAIQLRRVARDVFTMVMKCDKQKIADLLRTSPTFPSGDIPADAFVAIHEHLCGAQDGRVLAAGAFLDDCSDDGFRRWASRANGVQFGTTVPISTYRDALCVVNQGDYVPKEPTSIRDRLLALTTPVARVSSLEFRGISTDYPLSWSGFVVEYLDQESVESTVIGTARVATVIGIDHRGTAYLPETLFYEGTDTRP